MMTAKRNSRLAREKEQILANPLFKLQEQKENVWLITFDGAQETPYAGESFTLRFEFPDQYPISSPEVVFSSRPPEHPHIYSNGYICLSILYDHWTPALKVESVVYSILSMMSSQKVKQKPASDMFDTTRRPKELHWSFHDDKC